MTGAERIALDSKIDILEEIGPALGRPTVDPSKGSRFPNMKELRIQHPGKPCRGIFAFDPRQTAILLIGVRKGKKKWHEKMIAPADDVHAKYLEEPKKEGLI